LAFVRQNNLFVTDLTNGKEIQLTSDGKQNFIINGAPDWVYEEEFKLNKTFEWSPDSKFLAWVRFDESKVPQFSMSMFQGQTPSLEENKLYPGVTTFKYPKAGDPNSIVTVHAYSLTTGEIKTMNIGTETDNYIPRIRFTQDPGQLVIFRLNRLQNKLELLVADPETGNTKVLLTEINKYYLDEDYFDDIHFLEDKIHFNLTSECDGKSHIYLYNMQGKLINQVTKGNFDVKALNGCDVKNRLFYYTSAEPTPYQREVYSIKWDGSDKKKLSVNTGTNSIRFSEGFKYYTITSSNVQSPPLTVLYDCKGKTMRILDNSKAMSEKLREYRFSFREFFNFNTTEKVNLYGWILKPIDFDAEKKYPVLMTQYSGPNSQKALDEWSLNWEN